VDEMLATATAHWGPRLTANGVLPSDFTRVISTISTWKEWCPAWIGVGRTHEDLGNRAQAEGRSRSAGQHFVRAAVSYHFGKFLYFEDMEQAGIAATSAARCLAAALPNLDTPARRIEFPFEGGTMVGVLLTPRTSGPHPLVAMIPGLDSTKEELVAPADNFITRGMATLLLDGPGQGEAEASLPIRPDYETALAAVLAQLAMEPDVDQERIGVWGVSLGGYYAARCASALPQIRACVSLSGPFRMQPMIEAAPPMTREAFRRRSFSTDMAAALKKAGTLTLEGRAEKISCPMLVIGGKRDRLIPWEDQARLADEAGGELLLLDEGNHGCANLPDHHRPYTADWLAGKLQAA
jgi:dienelactone hydrolase